MKNKTLLLLIILLTLSACQENLTGQSYQQDERFSTAAYTIQENENNIVISVSDQLIYKHAYLSNDQQEWQQIQLTGEQLSTTNYLRGPIQHTISFDELTRSEENYLLIYSCRRDEGWNCNENKWQIQKFQIPTSNPEEKSTPEIPEDNPEYFNEQGEQIKPIALVSNQISTNDYSNDWYGSPRGAVTINNKLRVYYQNRGSQRTEYIELEENMQEWSEPVATNIPMDMTMFTRAEGEILCFQPSSDDGEIGLLMDDFHPTRGCENVRNEMYDWRIDGTLGPEYVDGRYVQLGRVRGYGSEQTGRWNRDLPPYPRIQDHQEVLEADRPSWLSEEDMEAWIKDRRGVSIHISEDGSDWSSKILADPIEYSQPGFRGWNTRSEDGIADFYSAVPLENNRAFIKVYWKEKDRFIDRTTYSDSYDDPSEVRSRFRFTGETTIIPATYTENTLTLTSTESVIPREFHERKAHKDIFWATKPNRLEWGQATPFTPIEKNEYVYLFYQYRDDIHYEAHPNGNSGNLLSGIYMYRMTQNQYESLFQPSNEESTPDEEIQNSTDTENSDYDLSALSTKGSDWQVQGMIIPNGGIVAGVVDIGDGWAAMLKQKQQKVDGVWSNAGDVVFSQDLKEWSSVGPNGPVDNPVLIDPMPWQGTQTGTSGAQIPHRIAPRTLIEFEGTYYTYTRDRNGAYEGMRATGVFSSEDLINWQGYESWFVSTPEVLAKIPSESPPYFSDTDTANARCYLSSATIGPDGYIYVVINIDLATGGEQKMVFKGTDPTDFSTFEFVPMPWHQEQGYEGGREVDNIYYVDNKWIWIGRGDAGFNSIAVVEMPDMVFDKNDAEKFESEYPDNSIPITTGGPRETIYPFLFKGQWHLLYDDNNPDRNIHLASQIR